MVEIANLIRVKPTPILELYFDFERTLLLGLYRSPHQHAEGGRARDTRRRPDE
jgi:hypothetical protein